MPAVKVRTFPPTWQFCIPLSIAGKVECENSKPPQGVPRQWIAERTFAAVQSRRLRHEVCTKYKASPSAASS
jgi:hypothetical protein